MSTRLVLATALPLALAGCQTLNDMARSVTSDEEPAAEAAPAPTAVAPAAPLGGPAIGLAGMQGDRLRALWGEPTLTRKEPGAEMWQYSGSGGCTLLVYLYGGAVTHAEAVPGGSDAAAVAACAKASGKPPLAPVS